MFQLHSIQETIASDKIKCDALTLLFGYCAVQEPHLRMRHLDFILKSRPHNPLHIYPDKPYLQIEVVDTESGDLLEFKCLKHIHQYNISKHIYPDYLLNIFK